MGRNRGEEEEEEEEGGGGGRRRRRKKKKKEKTKAVQPSLPINPFLTPLPKTPLLNPFRTTHSISITNIPAFFKDNVGRLNCRA